MCRHAPPTQAGEQIGVHNVARLFVDQRSDFRSLPVIRHDMIPILLGEFPLNV